MTPLTHEEEQILETLFEKILQRKQLISSPDTDSSSSYTASLFRKGVHALNAKVEEEADETIEAALTLFHLKNPKAAGQTSQSSEPSNGDTLATAQAHLVHELADVLYHLFALAAYSDVSLQDIKKELHKRSLPSSE